MADAANISNDIKDLNSVSAMNSSEDLLNKSNSNKNLAQVLLKESTNFLNDSQAKAEKAREYLNVSDDLKKKAAAVRVRADKLREGKLSEEEKTKAVNEIINMLPDELKMLIPSNASAEVLDKIANELESRAKELDRKSTRLNSSHSDRSRMPSSA